jgi:hypothetical protein
MKKQHQHWFLVLALLTLLSPTVVLARQPETPAPVELSNPNKHINVFKPSTQVNYDETVIIHAPPPEQEAPKSIPVKRFGWLNIDSKPLNPAQQNR